METDVGFQDPALHVVWFEGGDDQGCRKGILNESHRRSVETSVAGSASPGEVLRRGAEAPLRLAEEFTLNEYPLESRELARWQSRRYARAPSPRSHRDVQRAGFKCQAPREDSSTLSWTAKLVVGLDN